MSRVTELTAELIVSGDQAGEPVMSPDGRWVAWMTSRAGGEPDSSLWLAAIGAGAGPIRLGDGSAAARLPRWSPDSTWLFYVVGEEIRRRRADGDGPGGAD